MSQRDQATEPAINPKESQQEITGVSQMCNQKETGQTASTEPDVSQMIRNAKREAREARDFYARVRDQIRAKKITGIDLAFAQQAWNYWMGVHNGLAIATQTGAIQTAEIADLVDTARSEVRNVAKNLREPDQCDCQCCQLAREV